MLGGRLQLGPSRRGRPATPGIARWGCGLLAVALAAVAVAGCLSPGAPHAAATPDGAGDVAAWADACRAAPEGFQPCLQQRFAALAQRDGIGLAMARLAALSDADRATALGAHEVEHAIGFAAVAGGTDVRGAVRACPSSMVSGCVHGALEAYLVGKAPASGTPTVTAADLAGLCSHPDSREARATAAQFNCLHGVGHGLDMLAALDWQQALDWCALLESPTANYLCVGGVFMENAMASEAHLVQGAAGHHGHQAASARSPAWNASDLSYPCDRVAEPLATQCWVLQSQLVLAHTHQDWDQAIAACQGAGLHETTCVEGFGRDVAAAVSDDPGGIIPLCARLRNASQGDCAGGAVLAAINVHQSLAPGLLICEQVPKVWKWDCYGAVGVINGGNPDPAARAKACSRVEETYRDRCAGVT